MADKLLSLDEVVDIPDFAINHPDVNANTKIAFFTGEPQNLGNVKYSADPSKPIRIIGVNTEGKLHDKDRGHTNTIDAATKTILHELQHALQPASGGTSFSGDPDESLHFLETQHPRIFVEGSPGVLLKFLQITITKPNLAV